MVIDKIRKMSVKGVKSESFFSISSGVLELWRKNLGGGDSAPPPLAWIGLRSLLPELNIQNSNMLGKEGGKGGV